MKKILITSFSMSLIIVVLVTGCKKEATQANARTLSAELEGTKSTDDSPCKLTQNVWANYYTWDFHYNDKGFADEWKIDFGGFVQDFKLKYDNFNKFIGADGYDASGNQIITTTLTYEHGQVKTQYWEDRLAGYNSTTVFTHNSKGQVIREDIFDEDIHVLMYYDNMGNGIRNDYYAGSNIYFSDIYEFNAQVRNPLLTVSGVEFMFPYFGVGYFNKLWFTRNLSIIYDFDGNPFVINDFDASKTDFSTGYQNFPVSINYFDKVSETPFPFTFGYGCSVGHNLPGTASSQKLRMTEKNKTIAYLRSLFGRGTKQAIKQQIDKLKMEFEK